MSRPFVIYAQGRTGSHLLMNLLALHPRVECAGEVLNRERWPGAWQLARRGALRCPDVYLPWRARGGAHRSWGCKVPIATSARGLARLQAKGWRIVFLQRRSVFDRALSWCVASRTGRFQRGGGESPVRLFIPEALFRQQVAFRREWDARSRRVMQDVPHLPLVYEEHLASPEFWEPASRRLFAELELPAVRVQPTTRRSFDRIYRDVVENFDALVQVFAELGGEDGS